MKTLLIHHDDSYAHNLFRLIAEINGEDPVVVLNSAAAGAELDLRLFDNVVVSPGPGGLRSGLALRPGPGPGSGSGSGPRLEPRHPGTLRAFGIGTALLARSGIPVLGVCLGHQGIAIGEQALVTASPRPRHGHLSMIRHDGRELFRGLPQNFTAVRHHSLSVQEPLPPNLKATAWAEDGVLMGLRHRTRPLWAVQFQPESAHTEFAHRMLANFRDLTAAWPRPARTPARTPARPRERPSLTVG